MLATLGTQRVKLTLVYGTEKTQDTVRIGDQHRRHREMYPVFRRHNLRELAYCISLVYQYVFPRLSG